MKMIIMKMMKIMTKTMKMKMIKMKIKTKKMLMKRNLKIITKVIIFLSLNNWYKKYIFKIDDICSDKEDIEENKILK